MKKTAFGCTLILSSVLLWALSLIAAAIALPESRFGYTNGLSEYWFNYFIHAGGIHITLICIILFIYGVITCKKDGRE